MTDDEQLAAMFTAWVRDIDSEPLREFETAVLRGEHTPSHDLTTKG